MLTTRKRNALLLLAIVLAAGGTFFAFGGSPATLRSGTIDAIPQDAFLVATFDIAALRDSPLASPLAPMVATLGATEVESRCGFEPIARVRELAVAIPEGHDGEFGILARGNLSREEMSKCVAAVIAARGGSPSELKSGNFSLVSDESSALGTPSKVAWDGDGLVLVGRGSWLTEMIEASEAKRARIASNPAHTELRSALGKGRLAMVTATLPAALRRKIEREMQSDAEGENAMMQGVLGVGSAGIAIGTNGATTEIALELRCDTADACVEVEKLITKKKTEWSANIALRVVGIGALMNDLEVHVDQQKLHASAHLATEDARRLIERLLELRTKGRPETDAGAPPPRALPSGVPSDEADELFSARNPPKNPPKSRSDAILDGGKR